MKISFLLALASLLAPAIFADPVFTSTCSAYGVATVTGTTSCSIPNPGFLEPASSASISASLTIDQNAVTVQGYADAFANGIYVPGQSQFSPSSAQTQVALDEALTTVGPVRQGYLKVFADGYSYEGGGFTATLSDGPSLLTNSLFCGNCGVDAAPASAFTLGQPFILNVTGGASSEADPYDGGGTSEGSAIFTFQFTELDGTPVDVVTATPEPATGSLLAVPLGVAAYLRRKRQA